MSSFSDFTKKLEIADISEKPEEQDQPSTSSTMSGDRPKRVGRKPGRRSSKMDVRAKLERSRQSARECRARKKMRYQYLEDLVANREKAVFALRNELEMYKQWCLQVDKGLMPLMLLKICEEELKKELKEQDEETGANFSNQQLAKQLSHRIIIENGTQLTFNGEEVNGLDSSESNETRGKKEKDSSGSGACGGPEDLINHNVDVLDDIISVLTTEHDVLEDDDRIQPKGDYSYVSDQFNRANSNVPSLFGSSKGNDHSRVQDTNSFTKSDSSSANVNKSDSYSANVNRTKLPTILEESE